MTATVTFTDPKTWAFQEGVESSELNVQIRDEINSMGPHLLARKTSDQSNSTTTYAADSMLFTPSIPANEVWLLEWKMIVVTTTPDPKFRLTFPSGQISAKVNGIVGSRDIGGTASPTTGGTPTWNNNAAGHPGVIDAIFSNGATPGAVGLDWAANGAGTITVKTNSTLWGVKLA
jgi:hypothetical protein